MNTGIYLSYSGLGANLLHLSYCHQIAKKYGAVTIITLCKNLGETLQDDPLIKEVYYLDKYQKKFFDILKLSKVLKKFNFANLLIFYPSIRIYFAAKLAKINNIKIYNVFKKKNLHLVLAAKELTEKFLKISKCPTETKFFIKKERLNEIKEKYNQEKFKIVIGAGSSGPTTRWGAKNFSELINRLNEVDDYFFFILCGPNEKDIESEITSKIKKKNFITLSNKKIIDVIPYLCFADMYVGNDSFGSHITSQSGIKSIVIILDTPKTYTDYSQNFYRILPENFDINDVTHGSNINPNLITVEMVINKIKHLKN